MEDREIEFLKEQLHESVKVLDECRTRVLCLFFRLEFERAKKELFDERILKLCHTGK